MGRELIEKMERLRGYPYCASSYCGVRVPRESRQLVSVFDGLDGNIVDVLGPLCPFCYTLLESSIQADRVLDD